MVIRYFLDVIKPHGHRIGEIMLGVLGNQLKKYTVL